MIEGPDAMDSLGSMEAELGHEASADDRENARREEVFPSAQTEEDGRNGDHSRQLRERFSKESPAKEEPWEESRKVESLCRYGKATASESDDMDSKNRSRGKLRRC